MRRWLIPLAVILMLGVGFSGYYIGRSGLNEVRHQYLQEQQSNRELRQQLTVQKVALFFVKSDAATMALQPITRTVPAQPDIYQAVVDSVLKGPPEGSGLLPIFPKGSKVLGVKVKKGLAEVNLNQRAAELNVGAEGELLAIASIVNSLTKLPDVFEVKIIIEGHEVESLAGHVDLSQTFKYNGDVVTMK